MVHILCVWDHRNFTFLLGLHKRVGSGMLRWCRTASHFDPHAFRHVFELLYPPDPKVTPKLFPIPFIREYTSVMHNYGLELQQDQDLEIPTMGEHDHDVM